MTTALAPAALSRFAVHCLGDWVRDQYNTRSERHGESVKEYHSLDEIPHPVDRSTFEWMLQEGMPVTQCGNTVYQIRG